jgi:hypothetical protein
MLLRAAAAMIALLTVVIAASIWLFVSALGALGESFSAGRSVDSVTPLPSLSHFVSDVRGTIDAADVSLSELSDVTLRLEQGTRDAAVAIDGAGRMVGGDVASSLEAVETALPGLIEAASVIDGTLQTLSVFGVGYDPAVPFDDAFADLEACFDGLPARVRLQG